MDHKNRRSCHATKAKSPTATPRKEPRDWVRIRVKEVSTREESKIGLYHARKIPDSRAFVANRIVLNSRPAQRRLARTGIKKINVAPTVLC
jgi:hypothetical protein